MRSNELTREADRRFLDIYMVSDRKRVFQHPHLFLLYALYKAGADDIVRETFDSSLRAGRYVLENAGFTEFEASRAEDTFYHHDRETVRELAELWDPDIPADKNEDYIARSKELEKDLEAALHALLAEDEEAA